MFKNLLLVFMLPRSRIKEGRCSASGFEVTVDGQKWITAGYNEKDTVAPNDEIAIQKRIAAGAGAVFLTMIIYMWIASLPLWLVLPGVFALILINYFTHICWFALKLRTASPLWAEYHAAEHKTCFLIAKNFTPSQENFRKCPKILVMCGTSVLIFQLFIQMFFFAVITTTFFLFISAGYGMPLTFQLYFWGSILSFFAIRKLAEKSLTLFNLFIIALLALASLPAVLPGLIFEWLVAVKEPSPRVIAEAIELVKRINSSPAP